VKQIIAIVKPYLAEKLVEALRRAPLEALTVREVKGYGRQKDYLSEYGQSEYALAFLPKVEIEAWADDARVAEVVERIMSIAHTGRMGDGKVFVLPLNQFENM
jgi:nitrogen regulatory protein P-II 1